MSKELREMLGIETREIEIALVRTAIEKIKLTNLRERARKAVELQRAVNYIRSQDQKVYA